VQRNYIELIALSKRKVKMKKVNFIEKTATAIILVAVIYACFVVLGFEADAFMAVVRWAL